MRVLLTGGTGLVGSYAAVALRDAGHDVRLLVRSPDKAAGVFARHDVTFGPDHLITGDITDEASVQSALEGSDAVVHAAAVTAVDRRSAAEVLATNEAGVRNVVGLAVERGIDPVIYTSSVSALFPPDTPVIGPDTAVADPTSAYGRSKADAERFVRALQHDGAPVCVLYPGGVWAPHDPNLGPVMRGVVANYESGTPILKRGGFTVLDARDLADLVVQATIAGRGPRRLVVGWHTLTTDALTRLLALVGGRKVRRLRIPPRLLRGIGRVNDGLMRVLPADFAMTHEGMEYLTRWPGSDDRAALEVLGRPLRPAEETARDTVAGLVADGHLDPKYAPALV
jgi:nucleoside-diphosphate-sugar epimerase